MSDLFQNEAQIIVTRTEHGLKYEWIGQENGNIAVASEYESSKELKDVISNFNLVKLCDDPLRGIVWYRKAQTI